MRLQFISYGSVCVGLALFAPCEGPAETFGTLPLQPTQFSVFDALGPGDGTRDLVFLVPDSRWNPIASDPGTTPFYLNPPSLNPNTPLEGDLPWFCLTSKTWMPPSQAPMVRTCPQSDGTVTIAEGLSGTVLAVTARLIVRGESTLDDELDNRVLPAERNINVPRYSPDTANLQFRAKGGKFNGINLFLPALVRYGAGRDPNDDPSSQENWVGDMFVALDWGIDPLGNHEYLLIHFIMGLSAYTTDPHCLALNAVCQNFFGQDTVQPVFTRNWQALVGALHSEFNLYLQGAVPELLYLYDFSGQNTVAPAQTMPSGIMDPNKVIPQQYQPYTDALKFINQYDAGKAFGLPSGGNDARQGGNACGPASLTMDMNARGFAADDVKIVYANTMTGGLTSDGQENRFFPYKALYWLRDYPTFGDTHAPFPNPLPLPRGTAVYSRGDTNTRQVMTGWSQIDSLLRNRQPVVMRTDLGGDARIGSGHFIILLGMGHNDDLPILYGLDHSGDYYIVGDPAGHFMTNPNNHYGPIGYLQSHNEGANYGGWFAMYPKEDLRTRITRSGRQEISAVTIGPTAGPTANWTARSPVSIRVTDPFGNKTGIDSTGTVLEDIAQSSYEPPIADEDGGDSVVVPGGPQSVRLDNPQGGAYQVELIGTGTGDYHLDFEQTDANGSLMATNSVSGSVTPGQRIVYTFDLAESGPPMGPGLLQYRLQGSSLVLFWSTNAPALQLQTSTDLGPSVIWSPVPGKPGVQGDFLAVTNAISGPKRFYRLAQ